MLIHASANRQLDVLVEALCVQLSLTATQHAAASRAYQTLGDWLSESTSLLANFSPSVYPQGSIPLGTAVRPRRRNEFDADGVCLLTRRYESLVPSVAYDLVLARIQEHGSYHEKVEPRDRCIRINYEGDFHLDIVPAIPADAASTRILIPTRDRSRWQPSNPKGFADWFHSREVSRQVMDKFGAEAEPMPPPGDPAEKPPLQRAVQLSKRRRDVYFENLPDLAPKSILLTTLVANAYRGEALVTDTMEQALAAMGALLPAGSPPRIDNPSSPGENLARHWAENNRAYDAFLRFRVDFQTKLAALQELRGLDKIAAALRELFDPDGAGFVDRALTSTTESFQKARVDGQVAMSPRSSNLVSRATAAAATAIPRNSFYGDK